MRLLSLLAIALTICISASSQKNDFKVIAYYSGPAEKVESFDVSGLTHIIHCFSHLKENKLDVGGDRSIATLKKLVELKKTYPKLKVLLSLGGWTGCYTCSDVFSEAGNRLAFAESVKEALIQYRADGIDLDWEYPAVEGPPGHPYKPEDRENFTALVQQLRTTLGDQYVISFAAGGFDKYFEQAVEWDKVSKIVDFINLMSYDLVNGYSTVTGHHTPLHSTPEQLFSIDYGVKQMIERGVPASKIIIGLAFYGRVWKNVPNKNNGLYQDGKFFKSSSIVDIDKLRDSSDYQFFWDDVAKAPYIYNNKEKLFYTYDDKRSVKLKTEYAIQNKLGGEMFWELTLDHPKNGLLDEIYQTVKEYNHP